MLSESLTIPLSKQSNTFLEIKTKFGLLDTGEQKIGHTLDQG